MIDALWAGGSLVLILGALSWVIAANVLGRSSDDTVRAQGEAEAEQVATIVARHVEFRTTHLIGSMSPTPCSVTPVP